MIDRTRGLVRLAAHALLAAAHGQSAHAQTDEIQVYDAQIAGPGVFNLTLHGNYTPDGRTAPAFPGGIVPNHTLNGVAEWAHGAAEEYDDFGPLRGFLPPAQQQHQLFGVFNYGGKPWSIEGGVGVGLTNATDHLVLKLILSRDLN